MYGDAQARAIAAPYVSINTQAVKHAGKCVPALTKGRNSLGGGYLLSTEGRQKLTLAARVVTIRQRNEHELPAHDAAWSGAGGGRVEGVHDQNTLDER
jgi:hypothetical protein